MTLISHIAGIWQRRPNIVHWSAIGAVALVAVIVVGGTQGRARSAAAAWGTPVRVLIAQASLGIGVTPAGTQVVAMEVPAHLVPDGALKSSSQLRALARSVPAGGILTMLDVDPAASVSAGRRGIGIDAAQHAPEVAPGTAVELLLYADVDPFAPSVAAAGAVRVPAHVLAASPERWFVEIELEHVDAVARASATGIVVPVVVGVSAIR